MLELTWDQVAALRVERQHLDVPAPAAAILDVVRDLVAIQAQVMTSAELALRARVDGLGPDHVRTALWRDRTLVKTWAMRGTLHLVAAKELPELVAALGTRRHWLRESWLRYFGVTEAEMLALQEGIGEVLTAEPMTRAEVGAAIAARLDRPEFAERVASGWGTFLKPAAGRGLLCFGPDRGRNVTFVSPRAWLGMPMPEPDEAAVGAVVLRHLRAFPGASRAELGRWFGVAPGELRRPLAALGAQVEEVRIEGVRALVAADDVDRLRTAEPAGGLRLLAGFDPYTLSIQKEAEPLLPIARRSLVSREAGWISAVVLVDGRVEGTWTHRVSGTRVACTVAPWRRLARAELARVHEEAEAIAGFLAAGGTAEVRIEPLPA